MKRTAGTIAALALSAATWVFVGAQQPAVALAGCTDWSAAPAPAVLSTLAAKSRAPLYFQVDLGVLRTLLESASEAAPARLCFPLPSPDGHSLQFDVRPARVGRVPVGFEFRPFKGTGVEDAKDYARLTLGPTGLDGLIISPRGVTVIEPEANGRHMVTYRSDLAGTPIGICLTTGNGDIGGLPSSSEAWPLLSLRIAPYISHSYAQLHAGATHETLGRVLTSINIVSGILEHEANVELRAVLDTSLIDTGPVRTFEAAQAFLDAAIGSDAYDVGHRLLGTGNSGLSASTACDPKNKAHAESGYGGSHLSIEILAHEIAHQLGATHTFNGSGFSQMRSRGTAYEPGNGSSLLSYAGVSGGNHLQVTRRDYYLLPQTIHQIRARVSGCSSDTLPVPPANVPPVVTLERPEWHVPKGTPFVLTAAVSDDNGEDDVVFVRWEGNDAGADEDQAPPIFRARWTGNGAVRSFPAGQFSGSFAPPLGESRPGSAMTLRFIAFARDRGFGVGRANVDVHIRECGPLAIAAPPDVEADGALEVSWTMPCDGEQNRLMRIVLMVGDTANPRTMELHPGVPGSARIFTTTIETGDIPEGSEARVRLEAVGHIYYAVSPTFAIRP